MIILDTRVLEDYWYLLQITCQHSSRMYVINPREVVDTLMGDMCGAGEL